MKSEDSTYLNFFLPEMTPLQTDLFEKHAKNDGLVWFRVHVICIRCFLGFTKSNLMNHGRGCYSKDHHFYSCKSWTATFWEKYMTWHGSSAVVCMNNRYLLLSTFVFFVPLLFFLLLCILKPLGAKNATRRVWENFPLKGIVLVVSL